MYVHLVPTAFAPPGTREDSWPWADDHRAQLNRLFEQRPRRPAALPVNAYVADEVLTVEALLPGVSPEDVRVTVEQGVLTLAATRHGATPASAPPGQTWYAHEFAPCAVSRALRPGQEIVSEGKRCNAIFLITEGIAIRYRILRDGQRHIGIP